MDPEIIATAIAEASWVLRLGIAVRDPRLRERATNRLAQLIASRVDQPAGPDSRQLGLPL